MVGAQCEGAGRNRSRRALIREYRGERETPVSRTSCLERAIEEQAAALESHRHAGDRRREIGCERTSGDRSGQRRQGRQLADAVLRNRKVLNLRELVAAQTVEGLWRKL